MEWWKQSVVYQVYPMSFCDSNNDGMGDIRGVIGKLDYLKLLGIDVIWLTPVYASPLDDNGYDISDYYSINPQFGSLADLEELLQQAHIRNMKLIMDLVVNHTSDEHPWFKSAIVDVNSPYREYYIFSDKVATTQQSFFSGSAWEYNEQAKQYYFHQFSKRQPDLNWDNAKMRRDVYTMINWWLDKGIDGFRLDVIDLIGKEPYTGTMNLEKAHRLLQEMHIACFAGRDVLTVGETPLATAGTAWLFSAPERRELSMVFGFEFVALDEVSGEGKWELRKLQLAELKEVFSKWQIKLHNNGWNSLFWSNHDQPRIVSRFGDDMEHRVVSAKMLATLLHGLQGTPYIYQGEEIGMTNVKLNLDEYQDVETRNMVREKLAAGWSMDKITEAIYAKGRDNARTPMQWNATPNAGFSTTMPWLAINPNYHSINVAENLFDADSIFFYYQKLIKLRREHPVIVNGDYKLLFADHPAVFAYERTLDDVKLTVICNFYQPTVEINIDVTCKKVLIANYSNQIATNEVLTLRAYEAIMLLEPRHG
ncbi:MAG: alpha-glucosidase [Negativicutes bacterium]|jgi:oligo-1,6-glucosidase/glucan 1,6-alpha-glucosidase